jgi:outer membrane protein OmpA-like peptidoglycan-associated protein/outer membrane protein W
MNRLFRPTVVAALAAGVAAVSAQTASANVEIGGTAGVHVFSTTNELGVPDMPDAPSQRNSALFGLRLGLFFGDVIGVEGEVGLIPSESRRLVFDVWNLTYRGHLVGQFRAGNPENKLIPFVLAGGGAMQVVSTKNADQIAKDTDGMLYAGIGAKYRVDHGWGLRADARVLFVPSSKNDSFTEDFEVLLSIYKEFGRKSVKPIEAPPDPDPDRDGVLGEADKCPDQPGLPELQGCPAVDTDGDGIPDHLDKCPNEPETFNGYQDEDGCPDEVPQKVKAYTGVIQGITFKTLSADLQPASNKTLDKAVAVLKEYPELKVEIQGHTDDQSLKGAKGFADNMALSQARAETVMKYFVSKGIEEDRLTAVGFGDTQPVEDPAGLKGGKLNIARAKNRRVEFKLISRRGRGARARDAAAQDAAAQDAAPAP